MTSSASSFVETSTAFSPLLRFPTDTSKGGCCTVCDKDDERQYPKTIGENVYHPKMYPAFVQVQVHTDADGRVSTSTHKSVKTGYSILDDGCCNTCSGNDLEPPEQRYSEPHGGPFGLLPRLEGIHVQGLREKKPFSFGKREEATVGFDLTELCIKAFRSGHGLWDTDMKDARPINDGM